MCLCRVLAILETTWYGGRCDDHAAAAMFVKLYQLLSIYILIREFRVIQSDIDNSHMLWCYQSCRHHQQYRWLDDCLQYFPHIIAYASHVEFNTLHYTAMLILGQNDNKLWSIKYTVVDSFTTTFYQISFICPQIWTFIPKYKTLFIVQKFQNCYWKLNKIQQCEGSAK